MLFHEIYGCYYQCVAKMIELALKNELTDEKMLAITHQYAFQDSSLYIIPSIHDEKWQLIDKQLHTPLQNIPSHPLTTIERRWLKAISLDPKFKLFAISFPDIEEDPLFTYEDYKIYDQYTDGDPYHDEVYQKHFQLLLKAIYEKKEISLSYHHKTIQCIPYKIEYSLKNDKFRLLTLNNRFYKTLNISQIESMELLDRYQEEYQLPSQSLQKYFIIELYNERNALDRVMTHFSDLKKQAQQLNDNHYMIKIYYENEDETELIIRILSFGPYIKVIEPESFVNLIKKRLYMQKSCGLR